MPTMMAVGVARPNAHGQAMTSTVTAAISPCATASSPPKIIQTTNVKIAIASTTGTNMPAILSTSFCTGALLPWASRTRRIMCASSVSAPTFSAVKRKLPCWFTVPATTFAPVVFSTGTGSPLIMLSSTNELPDCTVPSTGILSPGRTRIKSPGLTFSKDTIFSRPSPSKTVTLAGCKPISFLMADEVSALARSSSSLPSRMNTMITAADSKYTCGCVPWWWKNPG